MSPTYLRLFVFIGFAGSGVFAADLKPPVASRIPKEMVQHGDKRVDDYFWLRGKTNSQVIEYLEAENAHTDRALAGTKELQEKLYKEMLGHVQETDSTAMVKRGEYFYYSRTEEGKNYSIQCRKKGSADAPEEILMDENVMAKGLKYFSLGVVLPSDDNQWLAFSTDTNGYYHYTLQFKDLKTGQILPHKFERVRGVVWAQDNQTVFFATEHPVTKRAEEVHRYKLGRAESERVYFEPDELYDLSVDRTLDREYILANSLSKLTSEVRFLAAREPESTWRVIEPRSGEHMYHVYHRAGLFYLLTNHKAKNYRVMTTETGKPNKEHWKELVPHNPAVKIEDLELFANHMISRAKSNGLDRLEVRDLRKHETHAVAMLEPSYAFWVGSNVDFNAKAVRFNYVSLVRPVSTFDYDMEARKQRLVKQKAVPQYDPSRYQSERILAAAADGTKIPCSLVYRKGMKQDGKNPLLLEAYGSYGISFPPFFSSERLALLDRGVVYVIAHIRGGGEMGELWREQGRMMQKRTTFTDFIACAEYLIREKYTSADRLAITGGSAGGLLMGAVINMRPDLFKAVVAHVPFVDVLNSMSDATLPLTTSEYIEWGNPSAKAEYEYIKSYSPYDNVRSQPYPAMLVRTSLNDSAVPYWEAAKWVAKLRATKTGSNVLLLKTDLGAGHGGASGRYDALRDSALDYAFLAVQLGLQR